MGWGQSVDQASGPQDSSLSDADPHPLLSDD